MLNLTDEQRSALGDCVAYLLERLAQHRQQQSTPHPTGTTPAGAARQGQSKTGGEAYKRSSLTEMP